jgi:hypothetical protein
MHIEVVNKRTKNCYCINSLVFASIYQDIQINHREIFDKVGGYLESKENKERCNAASFPNYINYLFFYFDKHILSLIFLKENFVKKVYLPNAIDINLSFDQFEEVIGESKSINFFIFILILIKSQDRLEVNFYNYNMRIWSKSTRTNTPPAFLYKVLSTIVRLYRPKSIYSEKFTFKFNKKLFAKRFLYLPSVFFPPFRCKFLLQTSQMLRLDIFKEFNLISGAGPGMNSSDPCVKRGDLTHKTRIFSSKLFFQSYEFRKLLYDYCGEDCNITILKHGGMTRNSLYEDRFIAKLMGLNFQDGSSLEILTRRYKVNRENVKNKSIPVLIGLYDQSMFTSRFREGMSKYEFTHQYIPNLKKIATCLNSLHLSSDVYFRLPGRNEKSVLNEIGIKTFDKNPSINESLLSTGLFVICYGASLPMHIIFNDIPFFLFWDEDHWPIVGNINNLKKSNLYTDDYKKLIKLIDDYLKYGDSWWRGNFQEAADDYKKELLKEYLQI